MSVALVSSFVHLFALNNLKLGDIPIDWGATLVDLWVFYL